jgi:Xaa-Pro aminopeptidase
VLFVPEPGPYNARFFGEGADFEDLKASTGVDAVFGLRRMKEILAAALIDADELWLNTPTGGAQFQLEIEPVDWIEELRRAYYWIRFRNISSRIHALRRIKDPYEIACLKRAYEIQSDIFIKIMLSLEPGSKDALGVSIYLDGIAMGGPEVDVTMDEYPAPIIVASGPNTSIVACFDNNREIEDGDLVLIDSGVGFRGYSSDISRTFPANGVFTPRQRELYAIVLEAQKAAIATVKPGSTQLDAHRAVNDVYVKHGVEQFNGYAACGHDVGLNIHDAVTGSGYDLPLEPGVVFSLEPMLMLSDEGLGIRIEDGVVVTETGCEVMPGPPKEIDEVEALCRRR